MAEKIKRTHAERDALLSKVFDSTLQTKDIEITENGTTEIVADEGFFALKKVNLNINVQGGGGSSIEYLDVSGLDEEIQMALSLFCSIVKSRSGNNWYISSPIAYYDYGAKPVALGVDTSSTFSIEGVTGTPYEFFEMVGVKDLVDSLPRLSKEEFYAL